MDLKSYYLFEAAMHALQAEILKTVKARQDCNEVPCEQGIRAFARMVKLYWSMTELLRPHGFGEVGGAQGMMAGPEEGCAAEEAPF